MVNWWSSTIITFPKQGQRCGLRGKMDLIAQAILPRDHVQRIGPRLDWGYTSAPQRPPQMRYWDRHSFNDNTKNHATPPAIPATSTSTCLVTIWHTLQPEVKSTQTLHLMGGVFIQNRLSNWSIRKQQMIALTMKSFNSTQNLIRFKIIQTGRRRAINIFDAVELPEIDDCVWISSTVIPTWIVRPPLNLGRDY